MVAWFRLRPRKLFLLDAAGALLTCLMVGLVLPALDSWFRMPGHILQLLAALAGILFLYSFGCFLFIRKRFKTFLVPIASMNSLYCIYTGWKVVELHSQIGWYDRLYFIGEIVIVSYLVWVELQVAFHTEAVSSGR
jgi:hypothetical protein